MNRVTRVIIAVFLLMSLYSCGGDKADTTNVQDLNPSDNILSQEEVMDIVGWVELKTDTMGYIGRVIKVQSYEGDYYVLDGMNQKCVLRYDSAGTFVCRIGKSGDGPGEYSRACDFTIDTTTNKVNILSDNSSLYVYNLDGSFDRKVTLGGGTICKISSNPCGLMGTTSYASPSINGQKYLLNEYDANFQLVDSVMPYDEVLTPSFSLFPSRLTTVNGVTYLVDNINQQIISYDCSRNETRIPFRFSISNSMPMDYYKDNMEFFKHQMEYNWLKNAIITPAGIMVEYIYNTRMALAIFDWDGNLKANGVYDGNFPDCYVGESMILSPVSPELYFNYWSKKQDVTKPDFTVTDDTNMLIMKWRCKKL